jgi:subtilisin-like proprotein convertase family protein
MLQANPNITWRDVRLILAGTAKKNDPTESEWTTNGAGYHINHKYGFGRIDAYAAVNKAVTWKNVGPEMSIVASRSPYLPIPDNDSTGVSDTIIIDKNISIEFLEINFTAANHTYWGDLQIELTSPSGTKSILAENHNGNRINRYNNWIFGSVRQLGEYSNGTWKLTVKDMWRGDNGTFQKWGLRIYGTSVNPQSDQTSPGVMDPSASPDAILLDEPGNVDYKHMSTRLNITVTDDVSEVAQVTIDLSSIGGSAIQPMTNIEGNVWSVVTNATGSNGLKSLPINATDNQGNSNNSKAIALQVIRNGDIDNNGLVNLDDAIYLARHALQVPGFESINELASDVDGSGNINLDDAIYLARHALQVPGFELLK